MFVPRDGEPDHAGFERTHSIRSAMTKATDTPSRPSTTASPLPRQRRNNPVSGALYFVRGFAIVTRPGIRAYVVVPLLINVALFAALIWFSASWLVDFATDMLPDWLDFLAWILIPTYVLAVFMAGFYTFNIVANLFAAPFNSLLAQAVERHLTGRSPQSANGGWRTFLAETGTTLVAEVRKLAYVAIRSLPLLVLFVIPVVNVVAPVVWMVVGAWMLAITYVDYPMANHGIGFGELLARLRERRLLVLGFGGAAMAALAVPVLNFLVIPCAVAGATAMWVEQLDGDTAATAPAAAAGEERLPKRIAHR